MLIRLIRIPEDGGAEREDAKARIHAAEAALARLEELASEEWVRGSSEWIERTAAAIGKAVTDYEAEKTQKG